jgi:hypothetical protein
MRFVLSPLIALVLGAFVAEVTSISLSSDILNVAPELRGERSYYKRDGVKRTVFQHEATNSQIDFVTNSGICETTPGVNQYSGYLSTGSKWLFSTLCSNIY